MPTNNMVLVLAKNGGSKAAKLAKQAAQNKSVKTATDKQLGAVVTAVAASVIAGDRYWVVWQTRLPSRSTRPCLRA